MVPNLYVCMKMNVCDVSHVYISVPALRQERHFTHFGEDLYMEFNVSENESLYVYFEDASDHYGFRPYRIVPFEGCKHIYNVNDDNQPYIGGLLAALNSAHGAPTVACQKGLLGIHLQGSNSCS